jgi:5-methylcytosine-specific restriction enzyme subunit McrC
MIKTIQINQEVKRTEEGKPILSLKEYDKIHFVGEELKIFEDEEKTVEELEEKYKIRVIEKKDGIRIDADWYVGVIEFQNFILNVGPKFIEFENLGRMIDFAYDIEVDQFADEIRFNEGIDQPIEFIISAFVGTCQDIIHKGLYRSYINHQDDIPFLKGKLILKQQILNDLKFNMKFNCEYDEFTSNNLENQIILYGLKLCKSLTRFSQKKIFIQNLIHQIDSQIEDRVISIDDFRRVGYTRLNSQYQRPHLLAKMLIKNIGVQNLKLQRTKFIVPFFVKMPDVFEKFVEKLFTNYHDTKIRVKPQEKHSAWYKDENHFENIKPDIITYKNNEIFSIIDAKYMHDIKEGERYQIAFYLNHLKKSTAHAILPYEKIEDYELKVPEQKITIKVKHLDIDHVLTTLYSKSKSKEEIRSEMKDQLENLTS